MPIDHPIRLGIRDTAKHRAGRASRGAPEAIGISAIERKHPHLHINPIIYELVVLDFLESLGVIDEKGLKE